MTMKKLLIAVPAVLLLAACTGEKEPAAPVVDIGAGKAIAQAKCSGCHGLDGAGKTAEIPNLGGQPADYLVDAMHAYREGQRHHAALQDLIASFREEDIRNIAGYFASLPPIAPASTGTGVTASDQVYREGEEIALSCTACHGEHGVSMTPGVPSLAGQQPVYLIVAMQEYANGSRGHEGSEEMLAELNRVDIEKMAMYFSAQTPQPREAPEFGDPLAGEALTAVCGGCHGAGGISHDPMIPNLAGQEPTYLVNAIKAYRDHERSHEDMVTDKSDEEIADIAAYYSLQSAGSLVATGEELDVLVAKCNRCHGRSESETQLAVPSLNGQKRDYLLHVMKEYRDGDRGSSMMHKMSSGYSDEVLEQLADWYSAQPR